MWQIVNQACIAELAITISYSTSMNGIIVSLKTPKELLVIFDLPCCFLLTHVHLLMCGPLNIQLIHYMACKPIKSNQ